MQMPCMIIVYNYLDRLELKALDCKLKTALHLSNLMLIEGQTSNEHHLATWRTSSTPLNSSSKGLLPTSLSLLGACPPISPIIRFRLSTSITISVVSAGFLHLLSCSWLGSASSFILQTMSLIVCLEPSRCRTTY